MTRKPTLAFLFTLIFFLMIQQTLSACTGNTLNDAACTPCSAQCLGCSGTISNCIACAASSFRINPPYCVCQDGYYDNAGAATCLACTSPCNTCTVAATNCTTCVAAFTLNSSGTNTQTCLACN